MARSRLHGSHRAKEDDRAACQPSLLPDQIPAPPPDLIGQSPVPR